MYRVLIYHNDDVVEDEKMEDFEEAVRYGDQRVLELGEGYWVKVKAD